MKHGIHYLQHVKLPGKGLNKTDKPSAIKMRIFGLKFFGGT